ncbi:unnamed protein product [Cochlearia groenlandica]
MKSKSHEEKRSDSDNNFSCKKHKKHRQSHGVCSLCLNEMLSKLTLDYTISIAKTVSSCSSSTSSNVSSCYTSSSSLVSSCSSPLQYMYREKKKKKNVKKQSFLFRFLLGSIVD